MDPFAAWNAEHQIILWVISGIAVVAVGAYPWAWLLYCRVVGQIRSLFTNHLKHLEARVTKLERDTHKSDSRTF